MYGTEVYEKVYFQDDYKQQFDALRSRYHDRTQRALGKRAVDHNPVSNISEFYNLHEDPDGGVRLSTMDFVEYFNRRYGGSDRVGAVREALVNAKNKAEKSGELVKKQRSEKALREGAALSCRVRFARRHVMLVNAFFAFMLMISIALLGASGVMLERSEADIAALELQQAQSEQVTTAELYTAGADTATVSDAYLTHVATNTTEVYEAEKNNNGMEALLAALAYLW